jgi:PAS domain S-box-containing protein
MNFEYTPYILPLLAAAALSIFVAVYALRHRTAVGAAALGVMAIAIAEWSIGYALEISSTDLETMYIWGAIQYLGIAFAPYAWLIFSLDFGGYRQILTRRFLFLTALFPMITTVLAWTTKWHKLIWVEYQIKVQTGFSALETTKGIWFFIHTAYSYGMILVGTVLLVRLLWRRQGMYRSQVGAMLIAVLAPWLGNILYLTGNSPIPDLDITPFSFTITVVALAWAIFGFHLVDIAPIARDIVIDSLQEGVVVLDSQGRVVDINASAANIFGVQISQVLGTPAAEMFTPWLSLLARLQEKTDWVEEFSSGTGLAERRYEAAISNIKDPQGMSVGRVMIVREVGMDADRRKRPVRPIFEAPHISETVEVAPSWLPVWLNRFGWLKRIVTFLSTPLLTDLPIPPNTSPTWYLARERSFTIILRLGALAGSFAYFFTLPILRPETRLTSASLVFGLALILLWYLGLSRRSSFTRRANLFLMLIYFMAVNEAVSYGFSVECFLFFTAFVIISTLLTGRNGIQISSVSSFLTLGVFAWVIGDGLFVPLNLTPDSVVPQTLAVGFTNLFVFIATSLAMASATSVLIENLNSAWQKEMQTRNLLQQERDLLEHRVGERTHDLQEAETKFRTLVEQLPAVLYRDDADSGGKNNYYSPQVEKMLGYPMSNWDADNFLWHEILHPDDREQAVSTIAETLATGHSLAEYRLFDVDGRVVWVRDESLVVRDPAGKPLFVQGIMQDITEIKKAEEQIRKLSRAIEQSGNSIIITDTKGDIEYVNPTFEKITGYSFEEIKGKNPRILKSGRQRLEFYEKLWETISSGNVWHGAFHNKRKDGSLYWENATIAPVIDHTGKVTNYVAIKEDVTARRETEEQLRKLSQAVEQSANTVIIMDREGFIEYVNPTFSAITGYSSNEAIGKTPQSLMNPLSNPDRFREEEWWVTVNAGTIWRGEFRNYRKDGSVFWESASIAPVFNGDGLITNFIEIKQDVTEQTLLRNQLQKRNEYLSILHQITLDLLDRRNLDDLLQVVVDRSSVLLDAPFSELMLEEDGDLVVKAFTSNQPNLKGDRVKRGQAILSWQAFDKKEPVVLEDYATWEFRRDVYNPGSIHAIADFPVMAGSRCLGVLALGRDRIGHTFTDEQIQTGILFARLVALVLDNVNLYDSAVREIAERQRAQLSLQRSIEQQQIIDSILRIGLENQTLDEILEVILDGILTVGWMKLTPKAGIFLMDEETKKLRLSTQRNLSSPLLKLCAQVELGQCLCGRAALQQQILFSDCLDDRHEIRYEGIEEHGHYNVPILQGRQVLGVIVLYLPHGYERSADDEIFLLAVADAISGVISRKRIEALLQESEILFRQIVENASDIIYRTDLKGMFTYANPAALNMMGFKSEEEVLGKSYLDLTTPEARTRLKRTYDRQYLSKTNNTYYEFPAITMNGEIIWVGQNVQLIMDGDKIIGFQALARNITQLRQAQEALLLARDQALEASRFKSQLVSRVSHELRTPLGGILGFAELLQHDTFGALNNNQQQAVSNIIESTNYLSNTVNDLLDQAQIESKSISLHNIYFSPSALVDRIAVTMSVLAAKKDLEFHTEIATDFPLELYADENRLQQIIVNLAGNAIKFTAKGGVHLRLAKPDNKHWSLEVSDTGVGIPEEEQKNIFEPFQQLSNSITRENRGSGLGLAIVKQLVELMGGVISLQSQVGRGSTFKITFPLMHAP